MDAYGDIHYDFLDYLQQRQLVTDAQFNKIKSLLVERELVDLIINYTALNYQALVSLIADFFKISFIYLPPLSISLIEPNAAINYYIREYLLCYYGGGILLIISSWSLTRITELLKLHPNYQVAMVDKDNFLAIIEHYFKAQYSARAISYLEEQLDTKATAKYIDFKVSVRIIALIVLVAAQFPALFYVAVNALYIVQNVFKIYLMTAGRYWYQEQAPTETALKQNAMPIYTVLIPMYKDHDKLNDILQAIDSLEYPKSKLDVKLVVEEDDQLTMQELDRQDLPFYIHVVKTPHSLPRTKPKALNYAINYCKGEYLVIYDAEDIPDRRQLLVALEAFNNSPLEYICLQAPLNFYNYHENYLSTFMSIEYNLWFEFMLRGLEANSLPMTLGGTSNHFRVAALHKLGLWDAFNVTEDADLGIRMYLYGYKAKIIHSLTLEEAPIEVLNWLAQRSRWIKGFMQTFLVYYFQDIKIKSNLTLAQRGTIWFLVGMPSYTFLLLPPLLCCTLFIDNDSLKILGVINLIFAIPTILLVGAALTCRRYFGGEMSIYKIFMVLILWPFYFALHSLAGYMALYEILTKPFRWNRTQHGTSKIHHNSK